jgi:hypothetical protein
MAHKDIYQVLEQRYSSESDLTVSMMKRAISELNIVNPQSLDLIYESVIFYTGDWPESEGWGTSDSRICMNSVKETLLACEYLMGVAR